MKNNQSNAFKWRNNLRIRHNKNIRRYANCSSAKGMSLWRLNIMNMVVITWTYISAVSWLCNVYPHLLNFVQVDAHFSLLRNPAFLKVLFRWLITDITYWEFADSSYCYSWSSKFNDLVYVALFPGAQHSPDLKFDFANSITVRMVKFYVEFDHLFVSSN